MSDGVEFQTSVTATPPNATVIATDNISGTHHQIVKAAFGDNGTAYGVSAGTPLPVILYGTTSGSVFGLGTFQILGTVQLHGTNQALGTFQPLAGSVHVANPISGTVQVHGTAQALGTVQPLAGSVHVAAALPAGDNNIGNVDVVTMPTVTVTATNLSVLGTVQTHGTSQVIGTIQLHGTVPLGTVAGTVQVLGSVQPLAGSVHLANAIPAGNNNIGDVDVASLPSITGTVQTHGTSQILGTTQPLAGSVHLASRLPGTADIGTIAGTVSVLGSVQPLAGSVHLATNLAGGTVVSVGSALHGAVADTRPHLMGGFGSSGTQAAVDDGDATRLWTDLNGRLQIIGTIQSMPAIAVGTISGGTIQAFGTTEVLGTVRALVTGNIVVGTIAEGTINSFGGTIGGGTIQLHGTAQIIGTMQPLAGSAHLATNLAGGSVVAVGSVAHGVLAGAAMRPLLMAGVGSSGTQAAVGDGSVAQLWTDNNGRLHVRGTIDSVPAITIGAALPAGNNNIGDVDVASMPTVTVQATNLDIRDLSSASDSIAVVGTVQTHGTSQVLGTVQTVAGMLFGSVQGWQAHDAAAAGNPLLMGAFGSSGTQAAIADGDAVRLWADLNGRLQVRGTIDSIPSITVASMPTTTVTGTVQTHGTSQVLGSVQPLAGSVHVANVPLIQGSVAHDAPAGGNPVLNGGWATRARPGTVAVDDAARFWTDQHGRQVVQVGAGTTEPHGTTFAGAGANGTILAARGAGSFWRIFDMTLSGSGGGTFAIMQDTTVIWGPLFIANNGGWSFNSAVGVRLATANSSLNARFTAGTWSLFLNYGVEGA